MCGKTGIKYQICHRQLLGDTKRAAICQCLQFGMLRENILAVPVWYI